VEALRGARVAGEGEQIAHCLTPFVGAPILTLRHHIVREHFMNYKIWGSCASAGLLGLTIVVLSFYIGAPSATPLNIAVIVIGAAVGWLLGFVMSPYSKKEKDRFTVYASMFGVFASGYLVSKADKVLEKIFDPDFLLDSVHGFRTLAFVTALILGLVVTFVFREYAD
jgi:hypothetical protein